MKKNNDTKDYSEQLEFLNSEPYYASKKIVNQSSDFPVRRTGSYRHKKALVVVMNCAAGRRVQTAARGGWVDDISDRLCKHVRFTAAKWLVI